MKIEQSYGIIPLCRIKGEWNVFLVQLHAGHWGFPKGHVEVNETPFETAARELTEETGLTLKKLLSNEIFEETYFFKQEEVLIKKTVGYFVAETKGSAKIQKKEIACGKWVLYSNVMDYLTFSELKHIFQRIQSSGIITA